MPCRNLDHVDVQCPLLVGHHVVVFTFLEVGLFNIDLVGLNPVLLFVIDRTCFKLKIEWIVLKESWTVSGWFKISPRSGCKSWSPFLQQVPLDLPRYRCTELILAGGGKKNKVYLLGLLWTLRFRDEWRASFWRTWLRSPPRWTSNLSRLKNVQQMIFHFGKAVSNLIKAPRL